MKTSANSKCANQVSEECPFLESQRDSATLITLGRDPFGIGKLSKSALRPNSNLTENKPCQ